jgi:hypothetical protein
VLATFVLALIVMSPAIVAVGSNLVGTWYPTGDVSHTELLLRGIPRHPPLVGVAARVGNDINDQGYTPGPSMAYLMFPVYLLLGRSSTGMLVSNLVLHFSAVWASIFFVRRWAGWGAGFVLSLGIAIMARSLAPRFFLEPWNVWIPVFAFMFFMVLAWGVSIGHSRALPLMCVVGTHCLQTHISYVPLVGAVVVVSLVTVFLGDQVRRRPMITRSVVLMAFMWLPPIVEQLRPGSGNLRRLWEHFTDPPSDTVGWTASAKAMSGEFNLLGPWVSGPGHAPYDAPNVLGVMLFVVLVGMGVWAGSRDRSIRRSQTVLAGTTLVGFIATGRIFGNFYDYLIRWMWVLAALWAVVSVVALCARSSSLRRAFTIVGTVALVGCAVWGSASSVGAHPPYANDSRLVGGLAPELMDALPDNGTRRLLRWHDPAALGGTAFGLVLEMEKRGVELGVDPWGGAAARPYRVLTEDHADSVLWLIVGPENIAKFSGRPDAIPIASFDPRSPAEREESDRLRVEIERAMNEVGHPEWITLLDSQYGHMQILLFTPISDELFEMVARYSEIRLPGAVFAVPIGAPLFP